MSDNKLNILIIEDSEDDALLLVHDLQSDGYDVFFERIETRDAMSFALSAKSWDIVLSDYSLPHFSGIDAIRLLREQQLDIPTILISDTVGEDVAVEAMKAGADDFFMKGRTGLLIPAIEREVTAARERHYRRQFESQAEERFVRVFNANPMASCISTLVDDRFVDVNDRFLSLTGYRRQQVIGHSNRELKSLDGH